MTKKQKLKTQIIEVLKRWVDSRDIDLKTNMTMAYVVEDMITFTTKIDGNTISIERLLDEI